MSAMSQLMNSRYQPSGPERRQDQTHHRDEPHPFIVHNLAESLLWAESCKASILSDGNTAVTRHGVLGHFPRSFWLRDAAKGYYQCSHVRPPETPSQMCTHLWLAHCSCCDSPKSATFSTPRLHTRTKDMPSSSLPPRHSRVVVTTSVESLFSFGCSMKLLLWGLELSATFNSRSPSALWS
jgi:hypothetical protein